MWFSILTDLLAFYLKCTEQIETNSTKLPELFQLLGRRLEKYYLRCFETPCF